jgi:hypothetical protein
MVINPATVKIVWKIVSVVIPIIISRWENGQKKQ